MLYRFFIIAVVLSLSCQAFGRGKLPPLLPIQAIFPTTSGILFPGVLTAAGVNPAALPQKDGSSGSALGLSYSPTNGDSRGHSYSGSFASTNKKLGLGVGYEGSVGETLNHGIFLGGGFQSQSTSLGIAFRDSNLGNGYAPQTDLGIIARGSADLTYGLVLYHMESAPQLDIGVGFGNSKNYNFEINVLMPPTGGIFQAGGNFTITAATTVYASIFGLSFSSSYETQTSIVTQSVAALLNVAKGLSLAVQYRSPNRSFYSLIFNW